MIWSKKNTFLLPEIIREDNHDIKLKRQRGCVFTPGCRGFNYLWSIVDRSLLEGYLLAVYDIDTGREGFELVG